MFVVVVVVAVVFDNIAKATENPENKKEKQRKGKGRRMQ